MFKLEGQGVKLCPSNFFPSTRRLFTSVGFEKRAPVVLLTTTHRCVNLKAKDTQQMKCSHCGRGMSIFRLRCQACKTRLLAGYVLPAIIVIAFIAIILLLMGWFTH
jgi:hypothetical protein